MRSCVGITGCGRDTTAVVEKVDCSVSGPQPDYVRQAAGPGWALVGDSGIHQDPWTGLGIDSAAISAELLVEAFTADGGSDEWQGRYQRERDEKMLEWFHFTVQGAADLSALPSS